MSNKEIFKVSLSSWFDVNEFRQKHPKLSADELTGVMVEQFTKKLNEFFNHDDMPDNLEFEFTGLPKHEEQTTGIFKCGGCGSSFDLDNEKEREILKKHNEGVYPCETFNSFCSNFGSVANCECSECLTHADMGRCDTCQDSYELGDSSSRCGDCGNCGECCGHK